jgi:4-alpha-glucanotransferase
MSDGSKFLLAVHNHQPVGNFLSVFEQAFADCYLPFLRNVHKHPRFKFAAHYSGPLLEYMRDREGEAWDILRSLVKRGQVELLGGGFYEPILSVIPERDRLGQLGLMNDFLEEHFGVRPKGIWLAERVWEPDLPRTLSKAGVEYTFLDEEHFHYAGVHDIHSYYITEDEGRTVKLFPIDKKLRYLIPFHELGEVESYLGQLAACGGLAILGDDGEKFGLWPGTKKWVYDQGWLDRFLLFIEDRHVETLTPAEALKDRPPAGRVYLPPASYEEMMEWALMPEAAETFKKFKASVPAEARRFLRAGFFREFFLKYPESNHLHKRMVLVSREVAAAGDAVAQRELFRGQGNDPLWHGVFGGLYLPHLRESAYEHLLKAERAIPSEAGWRLFDFDADGRNEAFSRDDSFGLLVKPDFGGSLIEIDSYPLARNLTDVLSRRKEAYHVRPIEPGASSGKSIHEMEKILPAGAERLLRYDPGPRSSALDHVFSAEARLDDLIEGRLGGQDADSVQPYELKIDSTVLRLTRSSVLSVGRETVFLDIEKAIELREGDVFVRYKLRNLGSEDASFIFGSEWNLYQIPDEVECIGPEISLASGRLFLASTPPFEKKAFPLQTVSQSERGFDIIHQGYCFLLMWKIELSPGEDIGFQIQLGKR